MKDLQNLGHMSLTTLVSRLREGRFVIPDFQREFEWQPGDISALMNSIFRDYYIGSLLLWKGQTESFDALACESIYGYQGNGSPEHIVLDGQQRLTAMHYAFVAPENQFPGRANRYLYFIRVDRFMEEAYDVAFDYNWRKGGVKLLEAREAQYQDHQFPLAVVGQGGFALANWVQGYEDHWHGKERAAEECGDIATAAVAARHAENAHAFGEQLWSIFEQYQIAYIELDRALELEKVCDIFTQINSRGIRLDIFDLLNALLRPKGLRLKELWRDAEPRLEFAESQRMNVYVLQVMSILQQAYCSPKYLYNLLPGQERSVRETDGTLRKDTLIPTTDEFKKCWHQAVDALAEVIRLLQHPQEFGAISSSYVPYVSILPAIAALYHAAGRLPANQQLAARRKIYRWYWASVFTNRYSGSVESTSARDFQDVKEWFSNGDAEPGMIDEFKDSLRHLELRSETRRGTAVYNGIFNLLVLNGARDWMTGQAPQYGDLDDHHIVPRQWGHDRELGRKVDTILNRTPLTADTNRSAIGSRLPNEYLPDLILQNDERTVRATLESHFISPAAFDILLRDPFTPEDFDEFLTERERTIKNAIVDLLVQDRLDLTPQLRELDAGIQAVELRLREIIAEAMDSAEEQLPSHVTEKAIPRLQAAAKKNPALDLEERMQSLAGILEFCDFRELQDIISNRSLWPLFQTCFGTKEVLAIRFGQLAELRNGIRHSRAVDEVTRMEGEAAIIWFRQVLAL